MTLLRKNDLWFPDFNNLFGNIFDEKTLNNGLNFSTGRTTPAVNITENNKNFEVEIAAPGMEKKDFNVAVENNILTISVEKKVEKDEKENNYSRKEFSYESFERNFTLPQNLIEENKIEAKYENGILKINLPKKEEKAKLSKVINIG